jgi:hypothetical protein
MSSVVYVILKVCDVIKRYGVNAPELWHFLWGGGGGGRPKNIFGDWDCW